MAKPFRNSPPRRPFEQRKSREKFQAGGSKWTNEDIQKLWDLYKAEPGDPSWGAIAGHFSGHSKEGCRAKVRGLLRKGVYGDLNPQHGWSTADNSILWNEVAKSTSFSDIAQTMLPNKTERACRLQYGKLCQAQNGGQASSNDYNAPEFLTENTFLFNSHLCFPSIDAPETSKSTDSADLMDSRLIIPSNEAFETSTDNPEGETSRPHQPSDAPPKTPMGSADRMNSRLLIPSLKASFRDPGEILPVLKVSDSAKGYQNFEDLVKERKR